MTNPSMVKASGPQPRPKPNPAPPRPVPAPESEGDQVFVDHDPMDSPQHKPMIKQNRTHGLKTR